jgi:hypothetical protein
MLVCYCSWWFAMAPHVARLLEEGNGSAHRFGSIQKGKIHLFVLNR